jgi:hypothetical protein
MMACGQNSVAQCCRQAQARVVPVQVKTREEVRCGVLQMYLGSPVLERGKLPWVPLA